MTGTYTDILEIVAPSEAAAGATVDVEVRVKNISPGAIHVYCIGVLDAEDRFIDWLDVVLYAGYIATFRGSFIMPNRDVIVHAYTYYEGPGDVVYFDDQFEKGISLAELVSEFSQFDIAAFSKM